MNCQHPTCGHPQESHEKINGAHKGPCFHKPDLDCICGRFRRSPPRK